MHENPMTSCSSENHELMDRLYFLKRRLKVSLPDNITQIQSQFTELQLEGKLGGIHDLDLFYEIVVELSRRAEPMTMGELSHTLEVPLSTATRLVDLLVKHDYVKRLSDPDDRRVVRVAMTETGIKIQRSMTAFLIDRLGQILSQFTPDERETMLKLVTKFCDLMESEN
jgi:DNA-binding MarR family transcriptional regulator